MWGKQLFLVEPFVCSPTTFSDMAVFSLWGIVAGFAMILVLTLYLNWVNEHE